jgi:hypothetical protein
MESAETKPSTSLIDMRKKAEERVVYKKLEEYFNKDRFVHFVFLFTSSYILLVGSMKIGVPSFIFH